MTELSQKPMAAVTWSRDVDPMFVSIDDPDLIKWGTTVPENPTEQQLLAIRLKWYMDVDEMFYIGNESIPVTGLLNTPRFEQLGRGSVLVEPVEFGAVTMNGTLAKNERPCKWLQMFSNKRFVYDRSKLLFKLCWPVLTQTKDGSAYIGGIAPLALAEEKVDA